jgi:hypothetical protein
MVGRAARGWRAVTLGLGKGRSDGQEQLADPVARDVATKIEQVQPDGDAEPRQEAVKALASGSTAAPAFDAHDVQTLLRAVALRQPA